MGDQRTSRLLRTGLAWLASGALLATSCSPQQLQAIVAGLEVVGSVVENRGDDDITFGEWLLDELD